MKKILLIAGAAAALILTGCDQGGTSDQYGTSSVNVTSSNSVNNAPTAITITPISPPLPFVKFKWGMGESRRSEKDRR